MSGLTATPDPLVFPNAVVGGTTCGSPGGTACTYGTITIANNLGTAQTISSASADGPFWVTWGGTCNSTANNKTVPSHGSCTLELGFAPTAATTTNGTGTINFASGLVLKVGLRGTGVSGLTATPDPLVFPNAVVGGTTCGSPGGTACTYGTITIANNLGTAQTISSASADGPFWVTWGGTCNSTANNKTVAESRVVHLGARVRAHRGDDDERDWHHQLRERSGAQGRAAWNRGVGADRDPGSAGVPERRRWRDDLRKPGRHRLYVRNDHHRQQPRDGADDQQRLGRRPVLGDLGRHLQRAPRTTRPSPSHGSCTLELGFAPTAAGTDLDRNRHGVVLERSQPDVRPQGHQQLKTIAHAAFRPEMDLGLGSVRTCATSCTRDLTGDCALIERACARMPGRVVVSCCLMKVPAWLSIAVLRWTAAACQSSTGGGGTDGNTGVMGRGGSRGFDASIRRKAVAAGPRREEALAVAVPSAAAGRGGGGEPVMAPDRSVDGNRGRDGGNRRTGWRGRRERRIDSGTGGTPPTDGGVG